MKKEDCKVGMMVLITHNNKGRNAGYACNELVGKVRPIIEMDRDWALVYEGEDGQSGTKWYYDYESFEPADGKYKMPRIYVQKSPRTGLSKARKALMEGVLKGSGVSSWAAYHSGKWSVNVHKVCHADVGLHTDIKYFLEAITGHYNRMDEKNKEAFADYFDYIVKRSPWKDVFPIKSFKHALKHHVTINIKLPTFVVMGAITALRQGSEYPRIRDTFLSLRRIIPESTAFALTSVLTGDLNETEKWLWAGTNTNHTVFNNNMTIEDLYSFMTKGYTADQLKKKPFSEGSPGYFGIHAGIANKDEDDYQYGYKGESLRKKFFGEHLVVPKREFGGVAAPYVPAMSLVQLFGAAHA